MLPFALSKREVSSTASTIVKDLGKGNLSCICSRICLHMWLVTTVPLREAVMCDAVILTGKVLLLLLFLLHE